MNQYNYRLLFLTDTALLILNSGCIVTEVKKEESEEERVCQTDNPQFSPLKNYYLQSDSYPTGSAYGRYIACISTNREPCNQESKDSVRSLGLYVYELVTGKKALLHEGGLYNMSSQAWSPDGNTVAYVNFDYFEGRGRQRKNGSHNAYRKTRQC